MLRIRNVVTCALAKVAGPPRHMKRRQVSAFGNDKNHIKIIFITSFVLIWKRDWDRDRDGDRDGSGEGKRDNAREGDRDEAGRNVLRIAVNIYSCQNIFYKQMTSFIKRLKQRNEIIALSYPKWAGQVDLFVFSFMRAVLVAVVVRSIFGTRWLPAQSVSHTVSQSVNRTA